jgi:FG-GAP-like repeat
MATVSQTSCCRTPNGQLSIWKMHGTNAIARDPVANPGSSWRTVGTGDFNGDGKADILLQNTKGKSRFRK